VNARVNRGNRILEAFFAALLAASTACAGWPPLAVANLDLIDDLSHRSFRYFDEQTDPHTGLTLDRAPFQGGGVENGVASIAVTGFAMTAFCIAQERQWISRAEAEKRVTRTLKFLVHEAPRTHGWFYHFMDARTGRRVAKSEVSSIDTAFLLAGAMTARSCFRENEVIVSLVSDLLNSVDFPWMMDGNAYFSFGWSPEGGFLPLRWNAYSELLILYVLGIGSLEHPISGAAWDQWKMQMVRQDGYVYIGGGPLFIHQFPLAWLDLRDRFRPPADVSFPLVFAPISPRRLSANYFLNAMIATRAQQRGFSDQLARKFPGYSANVWGLTASDSPSGYQDWGASLDDPRIDGTVAPSAAAGSLMFTPDICLPALETMRRLYGKEIYGRYGFVDAFNPTTGWVSRDYLGNDAGIALLSAENLRSGNVWKWFMSNPEPERALDIVGLENIHHPMDHYLVTPEAIADDWNRQ
jgi:hypothetical protein